MYDLVLTKKDLPQLQHLLTDFDRVLFNRDLEMVAKITDSMPIVGNIVISYIPNQDHLLVAVGDNHLFSGRLEFHNRQHLIEQVREIARKAVEINETLYCWPPLADTF